MFCPHCRAAYHPVVTAAELGTDGKFFWRAVTRKCAGCGQVNISLDPQMQTHTVQGAVRASVGEFLVYPKAVARKSFPPDVVPPKIDVDYKEACLVFADSAKASAALSRRCLQNILREHAKVKPQDLSKEIDEVLASKQLPSYLAADIDAIRHVGNFGAHPIKSTNTGEIVEVEPNEAEWLLDVLEELFDFYFVGPAEAQKKRDALNAMLAGAGKPQMKQP